MEVTGNCPPTCPVVWPTASAAFSSDMPEPNLCHEVRELQVLISSCLVFVSCSMSSRIKDSSKCLQIFLKQSWIWVVLRVQNCLLLNLTKIIFFLCYLIAHLKERLDEYIKQWNSLVKVFRNERREGLIQARSIGAQKAKLGQVGAGSHTSLSYFSFLGGEVVVVVVLCSNRCVETQYCIINIVLKRD